MYRSPLKNYATSVPKRGNGAQRGRGNEMRVSTATGLSMHKTKVFELQTINSSTIFFLFYFTCLLGKQRNRTENVLVQIHSLREIRSFPAARNIPNRALSVQQILGTLRISLGKCGDQEFGSHSCQSLAG